MEFLPDLTTFVTFTIAVWVLAITPGPFVAAAIAGPTDTRHMSSSCTTSGSGFTYRTPTSVSRSVRSNSIPAPPLPPPISSLMSMATGLTAKPSTGR